MLSAGTAIRGAVELDSGEPFAQALVVAVDPSSGGKWEDTALANPQGDFALRDLQEGNLYDVFVFDRNSITREPVARLDGILAPRSGLRLRASEPSAGSLTATVEFPWGNEVQVAELHARKAGETQGHSAIFKEGRAELSGLSPGRYWVFGTSVGLGEICLGEIELAAGACVDAGLLRFSDPAFVRLVDPEGRLGRERVLAKATRSGEEPFGGVSALGDLPLQIGPLQRGEYEIDVLSADTLLWSSSIEVLEEGGIMELCVP